MKRFCYGLIVLLLFSASSVAAMTKAQMQSLAAAITNAGYETQLIPAADGTWKVRARSAQLDVPVSAANDLAVSQGVSAFVSTVEFGPMTLAKMQAVTTAITNAGYNATASQVGTTGQWKVRATSSAFDIQLAAAVSLASAQAVSAFLSQVEYR